MQQGANFRRKTDHITEPTVQGMDNNKKGMRLPNVRDNDHRNAEVRQKENIDQSAKLPVTTQ